MIKEVVLLIITLNTNAILKYEYYTLEECLNAGPSVIELAKSYRFSTYPPIDYGFECKL